jgi:hypothetical protein
LRGVFEEDGVEAAKLVNIIVKTTFSTYQKNELLEQLNFPPRLGLEPIHPSRGEFLF